MENAKKLDSPELYTLYGYLSALGELMKGNLFAWVEIKGFDLSNSAFDPKEVIKAAYPESAPHNANIIECDTQNVKTFINDCLRSSFPSFSQSIVKEQIKENLLFGFWNHLKLCIDFDQSKIFEYEPSKDGTDGLYNYISWGFTFIVYNQPQKRCLIINGGTGD